MPNLTDVLNDEDQGTVEEIAKFVCLPLGGGTMEEDFTMPVTKYINYAVSDTEESGHKWVAPNGTWTMQVFHSTGYRLDFGTDVMFEIAENAKRFTSGVNGLTLDNHPILVSDDSGITGSPVELKNIISLIQTEYNAIGTPSATTFYIVTDTKKLYLGTIVIL